MHRLAYNGDVVAFKMAVGSVGMRSCASGGARFDSRGRATTDARERVPTTQRSRGNRGGAGLARHSKGGTGAESGASTDSFTAIFSRLEATGKRPADEISPDWSYQLFK